ncbi:AlkZ-related protein [Lachnoclostridium phytofermentans]|uniref:Uncharacterized protein n=1 Tax=Lachnoclostridium phytofermentans (strain ATCC 700394 / DSM 18823 / ISDg) TaxID=357809 RepID=A9KM30_LACP7|nr:hypothetical protein [Lachnoclostridium phytofermentans]ABX41373.1 conserved hypothetical protein [Lachnoclostridium phytofermentans ISDg]
MNSRTNNDKNKSISELRINDYQDFYQALMICGFTVGGSNPEGIFSLCSKFTDLICWHTENHETDPWEWRMRVLDEQVDIAYAKVFFKKSGYITKEWIPYFLSVRRNGESLEEAYLAGTISNMAKKIYELIEGHKCLAFHDIKKLGNFSKEDNYRFEKALIELQMKMYITMCGRKQKTNRYGEGYGWNSTVFCTTEEFWGEELCHLADQIKVSEAEEKIREHILILNPNAEEKKIRKFIYG